VVSSTGPSVITVKISGYSNGNNLTAQEFSAGPGATWSVASSGAVTSFGSPFDYPSLNAASAHELYYGLAVRNNAGSLSGTSAGFTYVPTGPSAGGLVAYNTNASGALQPLGTNTSAGSRQDSVAALVMAT
jgi:hypothetical protein